MHVKQKSCNTKALNNYDLDENSSDFLFARAMIKFIISERDLILRIYGWI